MARYILRRNCLGRHFIIAWILICNWLVVSQQSPSRIISGIKVSKLFPLSNVSKETIEHQVPNFLYHNSVLKKFFINKNRVVPANEVDLSVNNAHGNQKPFFLASFKTSTNLHVRKTRSAVVESNAVNLRNDLENKKISLENNSTFRSIERNCQRKPYNISFEKIGWEWIIAPRVYNAYYCEGQSEYLDNFYGRIMNLTGYRIPSDTPKSCCVPTKMSDLPLLYWSEEDKNIMLGTIKEMVVESCGCL